MSCISVEFVVSFGNLVTEEKHNRLVKKFKHFHVQHKCYLLRAKNKNINKNFEINQQNRSKTSAKGSLLNLKKVRITVTGNRSMF